MEKEFTIPTKDGKKICAKLRGLLTQPVIVLVHGLGGHMDEALHYNAARYFELQGFAILRFNLYGGEKDARRMRDCTLKIHGQDIDTVMSYLKKRKVKKVSIIGHSYGGPSILHATQENFEKIVFWDSSYRSIMRFRKLKYVKEINGRILDWGFDVVLPEAMVEENDNVDTIKLIKHITAPIKIICAGKGILIPGGKKMYQAAPTKKAFSIIKGATHNFNEDGAQEKLFKETLSWLK